MAESQIQAQISLKRSRNETHLQKQEEENSNKRHKSYDDILSLLDDEEEEPNHDISSLITTLQQELDDPVSVSSSSLEAQSFSINAPENDIQDYPSSSSLDGDKDGVIRHLLEASDDELGIPSVNDDNGFGFEAFENGVDVVDNSSIFSDGLWEIEDANANYYALLQSELFM